MAVDLAALVRRHKPGRQPHSLKYRKRADLPAFIDLDTRSHPDVLLDTNIYIFAAAGTLGLQHKARLETVLQHHCTVCLGELSVGLANRDVSAPTWRDERQYRENLFARLPATRTYAPDAEIWSAAGILAGTLAGCKGFNRINARMP